MLYVRTILFDVLAKTFCYLAVAFEQILTGHTCFTWSTTGRDDILGVCESLFSICSSCNLYITKSTLTHLLGNTFRRKDVIKTNVTCQTHRKSCLNHV